MSEYEDYQTGRIADIIEKENAIETIMDNNLPWHLERTAADRAWQNTAGQKNIIVAVLDTGINDTHEDLVGKVVDRVNYSKSPLSTDANGHGTAVAGTIAASLENGKGAIGVAYDVSLLDVKVADDAGIVTADSVARGIVRAVKKGARVINLSFTLNQPSKSVEEAINYAWNSGAVIVAAAGNVPGTREIYPAAYPAVIAVSAADKDDRICQWANKGNWVSVRAPGAELLTTALNGRYALKSGTSFAAAVVSGEAALLLTLARDINTNGHTNDEVKAAIIHNTDSGRINILKAVEAIK